MAIPQFPARKDSVAIAYYLSLLFKRPGSCSEFASVTTGRPQEDLSARMLAGDAPYELVNWVRFGRAKVYPSQTVQEDRQVLGVATGQQHGDDSAAPPDGLPDNRGDFLVLPGAYLGADDHRRRRDACDDVLFHRLPGKSAAQLALVKPWTQPAVPELLGDPTTAEAVAMSRPASAEASIAAVD